MALKESSAEPTVLQFFNPEEPVRIETDASDLAVGACSSQPGSTGVVGNNGRLGRMAYVYRGGCQDHGIYRP